MTFVQIFGTKIEEQSVQHLMLRQSYNNTDFWHRFRGAAVWGFSEGDLLEISKISL
jgi:hypothetical protein